MKIIFCIIFLLISFNINAGPYQDRYTSCILENTSERDRIILVKWLFVLLSEHPSLKNDFPTTEDDKKSNDMAVADYISYVLGVKCLNETIDVLEYEGEEAFLKGFELLGEVAFMELADHEDVSSSFERYIQYIDPSLFEKIADLN